MQKYVALVPVKPPALGKSRLVGLTDDVRRALAAAFALDTVAACVAAESVAQVLVATDDAAFAARARRARRDHHPRRRRDGPQRHARASPRPRPGAAGRTWSRSR